MKASDLALYAIINKRIHSLINPDLIDYFQDIQGMVYEAIFILKMKKVEIKTEYIKNYISHEYKEPKKSMVIDYLHNLTNQDIYIDINAIESHLEKEYYQFQFGNVLDTISDSKSTLEMKKSIISKTHDVITRNIKSNDFVSLKEILKDMHQKNINNEKSKTASCSIELRDECMKAIFGDVIYPHTYTILARPNDYKTTLLFNLINEFNNIGAPGILISFEDSAEVAAVKLFSIISNINKTDLIRQTYESIKFEDKLSQMQNNIFVMDRLRTCRELRIDLDNKLSIGNYKWIAIDYVQRVKGERYQSEYDKIREFADTLLEINKEYSIPVIQLTQAPKDKISNKEDLGMGDEKGAGEIAQNSRYSISINPTETQKDNESKTEWRRINIYKTTLGAKGQVLVEFVKNTGKIESFNKLGV